MALPNSNISVSMVRKELGAATNDVGRLCIHPNINKWSRRKPYAYPSYNPLYGLNGLDDSTIKNLNFFLDPKVFDPYLIPKALVDGWQLWGGWRPPNGGTSEPYRLTDFGGYNKLANPPYGNLTFYNNHGGGKVAVSEAVPCNYNVKLDLSQADIPLSDISMGPYGDFASSKLTLLIAYNLVNDPNGVTNPNYLVAQSDLTIGQGVSYGSVTASINTRNMEAHGISLNYTGIIVAAYIAPPMTGSNLIPGVSLQMDESIIPIRYFYNIAPETTFAHYDVEGFSYDDIPIGGTIVPVLLSYPRGIPWANSESIFFDYIRVFSEFGISGKMMAEIRSMTTGALSRTIELGSFAVKPSTITDFTYNPISPSAAEWRAGIKLVVYPVVNYGIELSVSPLITIF